MDQATNLRNLLNQMQSKETTRETINTTSKIIAVTSGKGGVGKTNFCINLAIQLSRMGKRVVIIDADLGLANIEVLFSLMPRYSLADVLGGEKTIREVLTDGPEGIKFISGGSGLKELTNLSNRQIEFFIESFAELDDLSDIIIIDTGAGISNTVINFIKASDEIIVVTTPEPTSITDAYAIIKTVKLESEEYIPKFNIVVNRVDDDEEGQDVYNKLSNAALKFLDIDIHKLGFIPYDKYLVKAVKRQEPVKLAYPNCDFSKSIKDISLKMCNEGEVVEKNNTGIKSFINRFINYIK